MTLRVVAYTKTSPIGPSSRYRYYQYRERLRALGVDLDVRPLFGRGWFALRRLPVLPLRVLAQIPYVIACFVRRLLDLRRARGADLVVVEHQLFPYLPAWFERRLGRRTPWILEFDDAIHLTRFHGRKMRVLVAAADAVVVGNEELRRFAAPHARRVEVVPTTIDLERYPPAPERPPRAPDGSFVVAWIGLPYNFDALRSVAAPLAKAAARTPLRLRVISAGAPEIPGVPTEALPWSEGGELADLQAADAGIMPLLDDAWSQGKCGLKILQYFAAGLPVVASPVGFNRDLVVDGVNGLLASDAAAWEEALVRLAADPALRDRLAAAGRRTVAERFSAAVWAGRIAGIWRAVAECPRKVR